MTRNEWILDVLADLKSFASANGLTALVEQLDDTQLIAAAEIASRMEETRIPIDAEESRSGPVTGRVGCH